MNLHQIQTHPEYVEGCFGCKAATLKIGYCGQGGRDATRQKKWDAELQRYRDAKRNGIQPESTRSRDILKAEKWSEKHNQAYTYETARDVNWHKAMERNS